MTKAEIAEVRALASKKERMASGLFVAEGEKLVGEMLSSGFEVVRLWACDTGREPICGAGVAEPIAAKEMERISMLKTPTPVLALVRIPRYTLPEQPGAQALTLVLDEVQDPGNMGTIIRLADWFGIREILCAEATADCFNPKVVQATMGAIARVRVHYLPLEPMLQRALEAQVPIYGTFLNGTDLYTTPLSDAGLLIMGNEGRGITAQVERYVSHRLYIPSFPQGVPTSESLNVAMATAITCAEFRRRMR